MGSMISSTMEGVMGKNTEKMVEMQTAMLERQIQMQNYMRERQMAMQLARQRELYENWVAPFYVLAVIAGVGVMAKKKTPAPVIPIVVLSFMNFYQYDMARGNKMERIAAEADRILETEIHRLRLPGPGLPTVQILDERRKQMKALALGIK